MVSKTVTIAVALAVVAAGVAGAVVLLDPGVFDEGKQKEKIVITDAADRQVTVGVPVERVSMPSPDMLRSFMAVVGEDFMDYIVGGLGGIEESDKNFYDTLVTLYPRIKDLKSAGYMYNGGINIESVLETKPDVVILPLTSMDFGLTKEDMKAMDDAKIPYVFIDFFYDPFAEGAYAKNVGIIGKLMQKEDRAREIIDFFDKAVGKVYDNLPDVADENRRVVLVDQMQGPNNPVATSRIGTGEITHTGGINLADRLLGDLPFSYDVDPESIVQADPDVIYFCASTYFTNQGGLSDSVWNPLRTSSKELWTRTSMPGIGRNSRR